MDGYRNSGLYRFIEKVAAACSKFVFAIVDKIKNR